MEKKVCKYCGGKIKGWYCIECLMPIDEKKGGNNG